MSQWASLDKPSLALKMEGATSQGMRAASKIWETQENWFYHRASRKECISVNALISGQQGPFFTCDLVYKITYLCCFMLLNLLYCLAYQIWNYYPSHAHFICYWIPCCLRYRVKADPHRYLAATPQLSINIACTFLTIPATTSRPLTEIEDNSNYWAE